MLRECVGDEPPGLPVVKKDAKGEEGEEPGPKGEASQVEEVREEGPAPEGEGEAEEPSLVHVHCTPREHFPDGAGHREEALPRHVLETGVRGGAVERVELYRVRIGRGQER